MKFTTITEDEFRAYANNSPYQSFMQTPEIATLRQKDGWTPHYLALKDGDEIKAATLVVSKPTFLKRQTFIAPGGPLLNFDDTKLAKTFLTHLKSYAREHHAYTLQISPYFQLQQRDRHGLPVSDGFNHASTVETLESLGFTELPHASQPKYMFAMDLKDRTPDQLFVEMKSNTRNHIRKAEKMGVKVRELNREELPLLKTITESTSIRRGFTDRPLSYYEQMYDLFAPRHEVKFLVAEIDNPANTNKQRANNATNASSKPAQIPISAAMFMLTGHEVVYLFSGSDERYMKDYNAQYLIQWEIIKYAATHHYDIYNFYGIHALPSEDAKDGIYDFKKGFTSEATGYVIELLGTYEAPIEPMFYKLHHLLKLLNMVDQSHFQVNLYN